MKALPRISVVALAAVTVVSCKSRPEPEKTPAQIASSLVPDVSPLDTASALPLAARQVPWEHGSCNVLPEVDRGASFSHLTFTGECAFEQLGPATCNGHGDDWYAVVQRKLADGNEVELYLNVEYYTGPGVYDRKVELLVLIRRGLSLYRWSNKQASVTLGFAEGGISPARKTTEQTGAGTPTVAQLREAVLEAEPGTATRGRIVLGGTIGCVLQEPVGR
jgi:hypothetical protein